MKTREEIIEDNILIADFMCYPYDEETLFPNAFLDDAVEYDLAECFNTDWNLLMTVVESINNSGKSGGILYDLRESLMTANIEKAWMAVVQVIKGYYNQKR